MRFWLTRYELLMFCALLVSMAIGGCAHAIRVPLSSSPDKPLTWTGPAPWDETAAKFNVRPEQISRGGE